MPCHVWLQGLSAPCRAVLHQRLSKSCKVPAALKPGAWMVHVVLCSGPSMHHAVGTCAALAIVARILCSAILIIVCLFLVQTQRGSSSSVHWPFSLAVSNMVFCWLPHGTVTATPWSSTRSLHIVLCRPIFASWSQLCCVSHVLTHASQRA